MQRPWGAGVSGMLEENSGARGAGAVSDGRRTDQRGKRLGGGVGATVKPRRDAVSGVQSIQTHKIPDLVTESH